MSDYLHGAQTREENAINIIIQDADLSNVAIIGTKPTSLIENTQTIDHITNYSELSEYLGSNIEGFTLPDAVQTVLDESGGASIYTINIFDEKKHFSANTKVLEFTDNEYRFSEPMVFELKLTTGVGDNARELELDEDYTFEDNTVILLDNFSDKEITASYKYADFSKITDTDVIGSVDSQGRRSGAQKIYDIISTYGVTPGIIIAPGFSSKNVRAALQNLADDIEAFCYLDCDKTLTVPLAEKARLKETQGIDVTGYHERTYLSSVWVMRYNKHENKDILAPYSPVLAGQRVRLDYERNVAKSIDNTPSKTTKATQFPISFVINKKDTDANRLNAQGLGTVINYRGEYRTWGARNSSFPKNSGLMTFESARRTRDFVNKSIRDTSFECIGDNISKGVIDDIVNAINSAFAKWSNPADKKNYIMYAGEAYYDETLNTAETISDGILHIPYDWCPLGVAEDIIFHDIVDIKIITKTLNS